MTALESESAGIDAVQADGGLVHIRPLREPDLPGVLALISRASQHRDPTVGQQCLTTMIVSGARAHQALVACDRGKIVGVAAFERLSSIAAEITLFAADRGHIAGVGTLLLEHLASVARHAGVHRFVAAVAGDGDAVITLLRDIGFEKSVALGDQANWVVFDLDPGARLVAAIAERERAADAASLHSLLAPLSIAVIGVSKRPGSVGNNVLCNILEGGFTGTVHVVNPHHASVLGVPSVPSPAALPVAPDLAIIAVPAERVPAVVRACGERGTRALVVLSAGFGETGAAGRQLQDEVLAIAREYGMRMVGPNCVGVVNTDPAVRLDATFAVLPMLPGRLGLVSQSGAFGVAFLDAAARCGVGVSQFVSVGNKADVSGTDILLCWEHDPSTQVIGMYLESVGDPRTFARIARRISRSKPILAVKAGSTAAGQRAGRSHTAAAASSEVAVDALFRASGVIRVATMQALLDATRVLTDQPLPAGPRVAIIGNSGGPGILAADAAASSGLSVVELPEATQALLRQAVPSVASTQNPVDLGAGVQPDQVGAALAVLLAADGVDAVLTVFTEIAATDGPHIRAAVLAAAATATKPIIATEVGAVARTVPILGTRRSLPVFTFPEPAAAALGVALRYARARLGPAGPTSRRPTLAPDAARELVATAVSAGTEWLDPEQVARLLAHYGIPACPQRVVGTLGEAVLAAAELGYPVVLKLAGGVLHKTDIGGVRLGVDGEARVRAAFTELAALQPGTKARILMQPMVSGGTELIVGAVRDERFGPLVMLGAGGILADLLDDRGFRLAPLSDEDADGLISGLHLARLLDGYRGAPVVSRQALRDVLVRVATLAGDLPEVAELDLNPIMCRADGLVVVDARVRVAPAPAAPDPLLRQLHGLSGRAPLMSVRVVK